MPTNQRFRPFQRVPSRRDAPLPADRRIDTRLGDCPPLHVRGFGSVVYDVSRTGISMLLSRTPDAPVVGERHLLELRCALDRSVATIDAEVIWCEGGRAGLRWIDLTDEQDAWLRGRFQAWLAMLAGASRR